MTGCCSTKLTPYETIGKIREKTNVFVIVQPGSCTEDYMVKDKEEKTNWSVTLFEAKVDDIHFWINDALTQELTNAGYSIINSDTSIEPGIEASAYTVTHDSLQIEDGLVTLKINVSREKTEVFERNYQSSEKIFIRLWELLTPGRPVVNQLLEPSLQSISSEFIKDLDTEIFGISSYNVRSFKK